MLPVIQMIYDEFNEEHGTSFPNPLKKQVASSDFSGSTIWSPEQLPVVRAGAEIAPHPPMFTGVEEI